MGGPDFPETPAPLKNIQPYLKIASDHDQRDLVVSYWARLYALQTGLKLSTKTSEETNFLLKLMDWLESTKKANNENEAITNDIAAQAHLENWALKLFLYADKNDRASNFGKNVIQSFYTAGLLYDVLTTFGELSEEAAQNRKYAKWKAAYIHNCLKNGQTPIPGPAKEEDDNSNENVDNNLDENEDNLADENNAEPGPSMPPTLPSQPLYPTNPLMPTQPTPPTTMGAFGFPSVPAQNEDKEDNENDEESAENKNKEDIENNEETAAENEEEGVDKSSVTSAENEDKEDDENNETSVVENEDKDNDNNVEPAENEDHGDGNKNEDIEPHPYNPAPTPTNPGASNSRSHYLDPSTSLKSEGGLELTVELSQKAQKYIKWAGSALNYDDVPTSILNLRKAIHLLTTGEDPV